MRNLFVILSVLLAYHTVNSQNIMISNQHLPNEPSIIIDPKNTNVLMAASNVDNYYISLDSGYTWTNHSQNSSFGIWGDPVLLVDTLSNFYHVHLSNPPNGHLYDRIVCQKSSDNGNSWSNGAYAGLNGIKLQDKPWAAIDPLSNNIYLTWTQFDDYCGNHPNDSINILFAKSTDGGLTWNTPKRINFVALSCFDEFNSIQGSQPTVGPAGEIYVTWAGPQGLVFNKSLDQGETWMVHETIVNQMPGGWNVEIPGIYRANGYPFIKCDVSNGPHRGTLYINWTDQRNGADNTDVWLVKSIDGGLTWSNPHLVNDDNSVSHQFFSSMTLDQTNGYLYFVFYDRRNYPDNLTDVYMALSMDGGQTFINRKISESAFLPNSNVFFGDYTNVTAHNGVIRPIWTRLHAGGLSIWTDITRLSDFISIADVENLEVKHDNLDFENYPNPTSDNEYVSYKLSKTCLVSLSIYNFEGKKVGEIINNELRDFGKYVETFSMTNLHIENGTYLLRLEIEGSIKENRIIKY